MRKLVTVAVVAAFSGGATVAVAADLGGMPPEPLPLPAPLLTNWSGFYLGLGVGGAAAVSDVKTTNNWVNPNDTTQFRSLKQNFDLGAQGVLGTVQAGYDYQFPISRWVGGVFGDFDWSNATSNQTRVTYDVNGQSFYGWDHEGSIKANFDNEWSVGGRLGYLVTPESYLYGLAAYTQGQVSVSGYMESLSNPGNFWHFSDTKTSGGWSAGLGLETHLRDNWYLKLEYRYSQFGSGNVYTLNYPTPGCGTLNCYDYKTVNVDTDVQTARLVLSYKFNRQPYYEPLK